MPYLAIAVLFPKYTDWWKVRVYEWLAQGGTLSHSGCKLGLV